jgi:hypothetical protein
MAVARKLKDPDAPITRRSPAEAALQAKRIELEDSREAHKQAVAAQLANEQSALTSAQMDAGLVASFVGAVDLPSATDTFAEVTAADIAKVMAALPRYARRGAT